LFIFLPKENGVLLLDGVYKDDPADISPKAFLELLFWELIPDHICFNTFFDNQIGSWEEVFLSLEHLMIVQSLIERIYVTIQHANQ